MATWIHTTTSNNNNNNNNYNNYNNKPKSNNNNNNKSIEICKHFQQTTLTLLWFIINIQNKVNGRIKSLVIKYHPFYVNQHLIDQCTKSLGTNQS